MKNITTNPIKIVKNILKNGRYKQVWSRDQLIYEIKKAGLCSIGDRGLRRLMDNFRFDLSFIVISNRDGYFHSYDLDDKIIECNEKIENFTNKIAIEGENSSYRLAIGKWGKVKYECKSLKGGSVGE